MLTLRTVLLVLALLAFGAAAVDLKSTRINLIALGLFLWMLAIIIFPPITTP